MKWLDVSLQIIEGALLLTLVAVLSNIEMPGAIRTCFAGVK